MRLLDPPPAVRVRKSIGVYWTVQSRYPDGHWRIIVFLRTWDDAMGIAHRVARGEWTP